MFEVASACFAHGEQRAIDRADACWLGVDRAGVPVAMACVRGITSQATAYLSLSAVLPSHRGHGLQLRLVQTRIRWARELRFAWLVTYTAEKNLPSANTLIRAGFKLYQPAEPWGLAHAMYWRRRV